MKGYQLPHKDWNCMHTGTNWWRINTTEAEWQGGKIKADYKNLTPSEEEPLLDTITVPSFQV